MAMIRCPKCGEKYSDTYKECPFCEEEEALRDGEEIRRSPRRGRRVSRHSRQFNLITPTLIILILLMAALLIYLLYGDELLNKVKDDQTPENPTEDVTPGTMPEGPEEPDAQEPGVMPEGPDEEEPAEPEEPKEPEPGDYETVSKLPDGLTLSSKDFTIKTLGESHTLRASGGSSTYQWVSEDEGIASVDQNGKVVAVSNGTVHILVTDGSKKAECIVRVNASGAAAPSTEPETPSAAGTLKAGAAVVVNGGNGVRVRSGPGTEHEALATVPNGAEIQIIRSAGNGWYEIAFSGVGGVSTSGYMKGEFLKNT